MSGRNIAITLECFVKKDGKYLMLHRRNDKRIMPDVWMALRQIASNATYYV